ncbi:MAG: hypothetical protein ACP59X_02300 [Solidesulfovibrio sp. DCME]|uniref:hypothetical protein n=1 Tax=Solidesulfovibrio sp. DCME TaxID=3447380 RepID=UPI003D14A3A3
MPGRFRRCAVPWLLGLSAALAPWGAVGVMAAPCPGLPADAPAKDLVQAAFARLETPSATPQAAREAAFCLEAAFAAGDPGAAAARGQLAASGRAGPVDPTLAAHWYLQAAKAGSPQGHLALGLALARGEGLPRDPYWAYWRLGRAMALPGLTAAERELAGREAAAVAAQLSPAERTAIEANLAPPAAP